VLLLTRLTLAATAEAVLVVDLRVGVEKTVRPVLNRLYLVYLWAD
jgi:hypothetical protein